MVYKCSVCGYVFDEEAEGKKLEDLGQCPMCKQPLDKFEPVASQEEQLSDGDNDDGAACVGCDGADDEAIDLSYPKETRKTTGDYRYMKEIQEMAVNGKSIIEAMGTKMSMPNWDDILIMGAQLNPMPLSEHAPVSTMTVIGKHAKRPMILDSPVYISHMSFGALSKETKVAMAEGSAMAKTAMCSGEGGILPEEREASYRYIFEYVPNRYSVTDENLRRADAIEIKIGQGTKPGMGGHLPAEKVTPEIAEIRNKPLGEDIISPSTWRQRKICGSLSRNCGAVRTAVQSVLRLRQESWKKIWNMSFLPNLILLQLTAEAAPPAPLRQLSEMPQACRPYMLCTARENIWTPCAATRN